MEFTVLILVILVGYYLSFLSSILITEAGRSARRTLRPMFLQNGKFSKFKLLYDISGILMSKIILNSFFTAFFLRDWSPSYKVWKSEYFFTHILCILAVLVLDYSPMRKVLRGMVAHPEKIK